MLQAAIFDLDGVIVFTDHYHFAAWERLCKEEGWHFDHQLNNQLRGVSRLDSLAIIARHNGVDLNQAQTNALAERKNGYYTASLVEIDASALVEGAVEFVRAVRREGFRTALGSASKNAPLVLDHLGITALFDAVVTGSDVLRSKPDPEVFLLCAARAGVDPRSCVVFEDAPSGVEAALAANMHVVGVGDPQTLSAAHFCIPSFAGLSVAQVFGRFD